MLAPQARAGRGRGVAWSGGRAAEIGDRLGDRTKRGRRCCGRRGRSARPSFPGPAADAGDHDPAATRVIRRARSRFGPLFTLQGVRPGDGSCSSPTRNSSSRPSWPTPRSAPRRDGGPVAAILGPNSMLGIDEEQHMEQRRLLLPPFKGQRMRTYEPLIAGIAARRDRYVAIRHSVARATNRCSGSRSGRSSVRCSAPRASSWSSWSGSCHRGRRSGRGSRR